MDPTIWGPLAWKFIFDLNWALVQHQGRLTERQKQAVRLIYESFSYLLPCRYCRESYVVFLEELGGAPPMPAAAATEGNNAADLRWAYDLKNKVNRKLDKRDIPPFEKVVQRMKTFQSEGTEAHLLDMLFIVAENYDADLDKPPKVRAEKIAWFFVLVKSLQEILPLLPKTYHNLNRSLTLAPITVNNVLSKSNVIKYLCGRSNVAAASGRGGGKKQTAESVCSKYANARPLRSAASTS